MDPIPTTTDNSQQVVSRKDTKAIFKWCDENMHLKLLIILLDQQLWWSLW